MIENKFYKLFRFRYYIAALLVFLCLTTSCMFFESTSMNTSDDFPNDPRVDRSFISGQPCESPCWYGLELGKSNVEDIQAALLSLPFLDLASIGTQRFSADPDELLFYADCVYANPDQDCIWLETSSDGKLRKVTLVIYYPLTLASAIGQLGDPKYYISDPISGKDACQLHFFWPDKDVIALLEVAPKQKYCIGEESEKINLESQIDKLIYTMIENQQDGIPWVIDQ